MANPGPADCTSIDIKDEARQPWVPVSTSPETRQGCSTIQCSSARDKDEYVNKDNYLQVFHQIVIATVPSSQCLSEYKKKHPIPGAQAERRYRRHCSLVASSFSFLQMLVAQEMSGKRCNSGTQMVLSCRGGPTFFLPKHNSEMHPEKDCCLAFLFSALMPSFERSLCCRAGK